MVQTVMFFEWVTLLTFIWVIQFLIIDKPQIGQILQNNCGALQENNSFFCEKSTMGVVLINYFDRQQGDKIPNMDKKHHLSKNYNTALHYCSQDFPIVHAV